MRRGMAYPTATFLMCFRLFKNISVAILESQDVLQNVFQANLKQSKVKCYTAKWYNANC